jgi:hypothetical protein
MKPNPDFQAVASAVLPKDALIVVGCKSGQRSFVACRTLMDLGFTKVANLAGGFTGAVDAMTGRVVVPGWVACGFPNAREATPGKSWEELKATAQEKA